ncbi:5-formyltetrahydrofolate cyclo-ligase [Portibacter marinus]|uniref:5-formyltetrahydrofolate cyclo-ligase n=1 Tax=Portibacter marinus TaxID=2898660 RepID=UPI001F268077|nr:5-formyltetrahydrofolate cyclo-ligase [Portibacter marinus]
MKRRKERLRREMLQRRSEIDRDVKIKYDQAICNQLVAICDTNRPSVIHSYLPIGSEIDILPFLQYALDKGKEVVCPRVIADREMDMVILKDISELKQSFKGTKIPNSGQIFEGEPELMIVPGVAFDNDNYRMGYGGGFYDRFLLKFEDAMKIGLAYPFQMVRNLPKEAHDVQLDQIIYFNAL